MNKTTAKKWAKALRSGEYPQAREQLKSSDGGYCCLGVLLEISPEFKFEGLWLTTDEEVIHHYKEREEYDLENDPEITHLDLVDEEFPEWLKDWFGISHEQHRSFIQMNDDWGYTFDEIADEVEKIYV